MGSLAALLSLSAAATAMAVGPSITDVPGPDPQTSEGANPIVLEPLVTVADPDGGIQYATVSITDKAETGDVLDYQRPPGSRIAAVKSGSSIFLYVEDGGTATASEMTTALRLVTYRHTGDAPKSPKQYTFLVTDGTSAHFDRSLTVTPVNDAPVVDLHASGAVNHLEQGGPTEVAPDLTISDPESNTVAAATVELGNGQAGDTLAGPGGTFSDGTLTIDFPAGTTLDQARAALSDVTFTAGGGDDPSTAARTVTFSVTDEPVGESGATSAGKTRSVTVQAVNDAPSITGEPGWENAGVEPSTVEEQADPGVQLSQTVNLEDKDDGVQSSVVEILTTDPADRLTYTAPTPVLSSAVVTAAASGQKLTITGDEADVAATLRTIRFRHIGDGPSSDVRDVRLTITDAGGLSDTETHKVAINPVNDAPTLAGVPADTLYTEDDLPKAIMPEAVINEPEGGLTEVVLTVVANGNSSADVFAGTEPAGIDILVAETADQVKISAENGASPSMQAFQTALRSISYRDKRGHYTEVDHRDIAVAVKAKDGDAEGPQAFTIIRNRSRNDPPHVEFPNQANTTYTEDGSPVAVDGALEVKDEDTASNLTGATISIENRVAEDCLVYTGARQDVTVQDCVVTFKHTDTAANYQAELRNVAFTSTNQKGGVSRQVSFALVGQPSVSKGVTIGGVNDAPTVAAQAGQVAYTEGDAPVAIAPALTVADIDDANLESATVKVGNGYVQGEDVLVAPEGVAGTFDAATGTLTISGTRTKADWQTVLRGVAYGNEGGDAPTAAARTIEFRVNDGDVQSPVSSRTVNVGGVNDLPSVQTAAGSVAYTEGGAPATPGSDLNLSDPDSSQLTGATAVISSGRKAGDVLALGAGAPAGITGSYATETGTLTLSGGASVVDYQKALRSVRFSHTGDNPGSDARTVSFTASDAGGASGAATRQVTVTPIADAPVVKTTSGALAWSKSSGPTAVDPGVSISDIDSTQLTGATAAIVGGLSTGDQLSLPGTFEGISVTYDSATATLTLSGTAPLARYRDALRAVAYDSTETAPAVGPRTVRFTATDGEASDSSDRNIEVSNDKAPAAPEQPAQPAPPAPSTTALIIDIGDGAAPVLRVDAGQIAVPCRPDKGTISACAIALTATDGTTLGAQVLRGRELSVALNNEGVRRLGASPLGLPITITAASTVDGKTIQAQRAAVLFGSGKLTLKRLFRSARSAKLSASGKERLAAIAASGATLTSVRCSATTPKGANLARKRARAVCAALRAGGAQADAFRTSGKRSRTDAVRISATP